MEDTISLPDVPGENNRSNNILGNLRIGVSRDLMPINETPNVPVAYLKLPVCDKDYKLIASKVQPITAGDGWQMPGLRPTAGQEGCVPVPVANESEKAA